jgi:hypothetical protein
LYELQEMALSAAVPGQAISHVFIGIRERTPELPWLKSLLRRKCFVLAPWGLWSAEWATSCPFVQRNVVKSVVAPKKRRKNRAAEFLGHVTRACPCPNTYH